MVPEACPATRLSDEPFNTTSPFELAASVHQIIYCSDQNSREYLYKALDYVAKGKVKVMAETQINCKYIYRTVQGDIKVEDIPTTSQRQYAEVVTPANLGVCIKSSKLKEFEPILRKMSGK